MWEPGERLSWTSSIDDVVIDVRFHPTDGGTCVEVVATLPPDGVDAGGTAVVRMTPVWLARWIERRDREPHEPVHLSRLAVGIHYRRPAAAARWLRDVFGLDPAGIVPDDEPPDDHVWIEFHVGDAALMVFPRGHDDGDRPRGPDPVTHVPWVFVDDLDAHLDRSRSGGATIVSEIWQHGVRAYEAEDLEGHRWTFAQAAPSMR